MAVYYNEIGKDAAAWLQAAMDAEIIAKGHIDTRSIEDVTPNDLVGFTQHHFFAGIGGWQIALRLAGWPDDRPVWTGSCPCQSFSTAGKGTGFDDPRHLWPAWFWLIKQCKPPVIFGEQVSNAITFGWMDLAAYDMEKQGYAVGQTVLPACSIGRPHKRDRLWFVADTNQDGCASASEGRESRKCDTQSRGIMGDTNKQRLEGYGGYEQEHGKERRQEQDGYFRDDNLCWIECPDGKQRPVEPSIRLLADGIPNRLRKAALHGYGNAIVPQVAAEFINAYMEAIDG